MRSLQEYLERRLIDGSFILRERLAGAGRRAGARMGYEVPTTSGSARGDQLSRSAGR